MEQIGGRRRVAAPAAARQSPSREREGERRPRAGVRRDLRVEVRRVVSVLPERVAVRRLEPVRRAVLLEAVMLDVLDPLLERELPQAVGPERVRLGPDGARAAEGERPAGAIVASTKVTAKIKALDTQARTATLSLETGEEDTFSVRPDVDMSQYKVGQDVVFLITDLLALEVKKV